MSNLNTRIEIVRNNLSSQFMYTDEEWLSGCVEYIIEGNTRSYSDIEICNLAKEQWLLNDLKDICPGSLPSALKTQVKTVLNGKYVLQVNAAIDIGTPAYQQYLKLQKVNTENIEVTTRFEDKVPHNRMIQLHLTDGVQDVAAIEYKPMRNLSCEITPGCKILLKGPIICRRGIFLLTEDKIQFLGGEVQEMAISNSLSGLISSKLGLSITEGANINDPDLSLNVNIARNTNIPPPSAQIPSFAINEHVSRPVAKVTSLQVATFIDDDIDMDQLEAIEAQFSNDSASNKRSLKEDCSHPLPNPEKKAKLESAINRPEDYPDEADMFCDEDEDYLREIESKFDLPIQPKTMYISREPFVYIKQIKELKDSEKVGSVFRIKGQISKLLSKLCVGKEGWSLKCTLIDGTDSIDADFTSDVLTKLVGYTPNEMNQMKKDIVTRPELKQKAILALQKTKETLQVLYCIIELTILDTPTITSLIPFDESHANLLRCRANITELYS